MGQGYRSMESAARLDRREFIRAAGACSVVLGGATLGVPGFAQETAAKPAAPAPPQTNLNEFMKVPRGPHAIPGPFPGRVVQVVDPTSLRGDRVDSGTVRDMVEEGITRLTGRNLEESFRLFFTADDVVGLKVNPVGPPLINTRHEVVEAVIRWLVDNGVPRGNVVIWDRFDFMLRDGGYTGQNFPGVQIAGLQTMDEEGGKFRDADGNHLSKKNFDMSAVYRVAGVEGKGVRGYKDDEFYLNQHVFAGEESYFGTLVTRKLTKIVNLPVFKNTGNGISMATKNLGYGAICNTGRLHAPLGLKVGTEVLAAPWVRDKLVLNITDALRGQYDDGPMLNAQFVYPAHTLYFATDPFAIDMVGHRHLVAKRREMGVRVDENPRFTEYLHYGEKLGLGVADPARIDLRKVVA